MPDELDELDDLTPPPENYTTSDADEKKSKRSESLAQQGKYDSGEETSSEMENYVAATDANKSAASSETSKNDSFSRDISSSVADATTLPSAPIAPVSYDETPAPAAAQTYADVPAPSAPSADAVSFAQVGSASPDVAFEFPEVHPFPQADLDVPAPQSYAQTTLDSPFPSADAFPTLADNFPSVDDASYASAPVAAQAPKVALNYEPVARPAQAPVVDSFPSDPDPFSGVVYEPQTTSSGTIY